MSSSMITFARFAALVAFGGLATAAVSACGDDVPSNAVATVGDSVIEKSEFDHWLSVAAKGQQQQGGGPGVVPDPPDFKKCVAAGKKRPAPKGQKAPTDSALKKQCEQTYEQLKNQAMELLVVGEWLEQEAEDRDIKVKDAEVRRSFDDQKKGAFPGKNGEKQYKKFLDQSGQSEQDILYRVRIEEIQTKITQDVTKDAGKISDEDIEQYYEKNKKRFAQPERRDLNIVVAKTESKADQARQALQQGQSFKTVAKEFSIDPASKAQGGKLPDVAKGQQERALDEAVFQAGKGKLTGPVKGQFGWNVFEVTKVKPASQQSLEKARETIRNVVRSQREQKALDEFSKEFRDEYKDKTECAEDFVTPNCSNAPKEETDTGPASGGSPQGQPPQAPPEQAPQPSPSPER